MSRLTWCSNLLPGEELSDHLAELSAVLAGLSEPGPQSRHRGVGLRLAAKAADELLSEGERGAAARQLFERILSEGDRYLQTINGFPYGRFHGAAVKDRVHLPDWMSSERLRYTSNLFEIMERYAPDRLGTASISTSPLTYRPWSGGRRPDSFERALEQLCRIACELEERSQRRGIRFELDLEPEPDGWLEDSATTIDFFERELYPYARREARRIGRRSGKAMSETIRNHIGVCFDTSHFSCRFENLIEVWRLIQSYSIRIGKLQLSSALELPAGVVAEVLAPFDEPQYLHQATLESPRRHFPDLGAALVACRGAGGAFDSRLRCHYHMPLFAAAHGKLNTSRDETAALLQWLAARQQLPEQIEIETYTRSLLAPELQGTTAGFIAAELEWVEQQIEADREESKRCQKL